MESFTDNDRPWHLVFHYRADLGAAPALTPSADLAAAEWFAPDALPERVEIAHRGWALEILAALTGKQAQPARA